MAVTETLELQDGLRDELGREPRRGDRQRAPAEALHAPPSVAQIDGGRKRPRAMPALTRSGRARRHAVHERARFQHNQLARLRRRDFDVVGVPFAWSTELDLAAVREIATVLARKLL